MLAGPAGTGTVACAVAPDRLPAAARAKAAAGLQSQMADLAARPADDTIPCELDKVNTNRIGSCALSEIAFQLIDLKTKVVTGYGDLSVLASAGLKVRDRTWSQHLRVTLLFSEGTALPGALAFATARPSDTANFFATPSGDQVVKTLNVPVDFDYTVTSPGAGNVRAAIQPTYTMEPLEPSVGGPLEYDIGPPPTVRCDSTPTVGPATGGCVYPNFTPTYDVSTTNSDTAQVAWHIQWAQRNLRNHWGWKGHGPALTRTMNRTIIKNNRDKACPSSIPRPPGKSCDEYPFASTYQGASLNPDFSCHMVPANQNSLEGSRYRRPWYISNRILDGDPFWVNVVLPANAAPDSVQPYVQCPG